MPCAHAGARQVCATAGRVFVIAPTPSQRGRRPISARKRNAFLEALKDGFSITHAAKKAGIARQRMYELRSEDGDFATAWLDAWEQGTDVLEDELRRRALGYDEVTYDGDGNVIRRVHRFDTPAIVLALKARRPDLYRDNVARVELTGRAGGPLQVEDRSASLSDVARVLVEAGALDAAVVLGVRLGDVVEGEAVELLYGELEAGS